MSLILFSIIILLNISIWKVYESRALDRLLILCIWTAIIIWYCTPGFIAGIYLEETPFTPFYFYKSNVSTTTWLQDFTGTFAIESLGVCCTLALILFNAKSKKKRHNIKDLNNAELNEAYNLDQIPSKYKVAILMVFAATIIYQLVNFQNTDYLANNSADLYGTLDPVSQLVTFLKPLAYAMTILIAIYEQKRPMLLRMAFGEIIFESILSTTSGARIAMITPVIIFIFRVLSASNSKTLDEKNANSSDLSNAFTESNSIYIKRSRQRYVIRLSVAFVAALCFMLYVFLPIAKSIGEARAYGEFNLYNIVVNTFTGQTAQTSSESGKRMEDVEAVFVKLDSFTNGSLLTSVSGYGTAGIMPYIGSALVFIPRFLLPERPVAGSSDGTIYNHPTRLVSSSVGVNSDSLNVAVPPLSIALWHFGYPGFILFTIVTFLYFKYLNYLIASPSFIYKALGIFSTNIPAFSTVFSSPDVVLKNFILLFMMVYAIGFFQKSTQKSN